MIKRKEWVVKRPLCSPARYFLILSFCTGKEQHPNQISSYRPSASSSVFWRVRPLKTLSHWSWCQHQAVTSFTVKILYCQVHHLKNLPQENPPCFMQEHFFKFFLFFFPLWSGQSACSVGHGAEPILYSSWNCWVSMDLLQESSHKEPWRRPWLYLFAFCGLWLLLLAGEELTASHCSVTPTSHFSHLACFFLLHFGLFVVGCRSGNTSQWLLSGLGGWSSRHSAIKKVT